VENLFFPASWRGKKFGTESPTRQLAGNALLRLRSANCLGYALQL